MLLVLKLYAILTVWTTNTL